MSLGHYPSISRLRERALPTVRENAVDNIRALRFMPTIKTRHALRRRVVAISSGIAHQPDAGRDEGQWVTVAYSPNAARPVPAKAIAALEQHGLQPRPPARAADFADPEIRADWIRSKGMQVFTMYDPGDPLVTVDLFVESPLPFDELWDRSVEFQLPTTSVRVVSLADLIRLKQVAGRPLDVADIESLQALRQHGDDNES